TVCHWPANALIGWAWSVFPCRMPAAITGGLLLGLRPQMRPTVLRHYGPHISAICSLAMPLKNRQPAPKTKPFFHVPMTHRVGVRLVILYVSNRPACNKKDNRYDVLSRE